MERLLAIFVVIMILAWGALIGGFILWGIYIAIDSWFLPRTRATGKIVKKKHTPMHFMNTWQYNSALKTTQFVPMPIPEDWTLRIKVAGQKDEISVGKDFYKSVKKGDAVDVEYVVGRFSGRVYIKSVFG
jgi:hypothetical protein